MQPDNKMKNIITKLKAYSQARPNRSKVVIGLAALTTLLLISIPVALVTREDAPKAPNPSVQIVPTAQVTITKDGFIPATLVVKQGTKIIWTNSDQANHQIYANPHPSGESLPGLKSEILNNNQTYEYTADTVGTFGYHDQQNPTTNGTLEVQE